MRAHPKVAEHLEEHAEECLSCLAFLESHRRRIRATNILERLSQEIKRRTRVVRIFPNRGACLRLATALAQEHSEEWDQREALHEHGRTRAKPLGSSGERGGDAHGAMRKVAVLEEITETSGA